MHVDWLILADAAQIVGGKLYLMGGGWDVLAVNSGFPIRRHCGMAAAFRVPWNEANQVHNVEIEIADQDGNVLVNVAGQLEVGRPPGIPQGHEQRAQLAIDLDLELKGPGTYVIVARIQGKESARVPFLVVGPPGAQKGSRQPEKGTMH